MTDHPTDRDVVLDVLARHRINYHSRNIGGEKPSTRRYTSCDGCGWQGGHRDEVGWEVHLADVIVGVRCPAAAQPEGGDRPVVDATWALTTPDLWESPDARSIPTLLAAIGQVLAATEGREARAAQRLALAATRASERNLR